MEKVETPRLGDRMTQSFCDSSCIIKVTIYVEMSESEKYFLNSKAFVCVSVAAGLKQHFISKKNLTVPVNLATHTPECEPAVAVNHETLSDCLPTVYVINRLFMTDVGIYCHRLSSWSKYAQ